MSITCKINPYIGAEDLKRALFDACDPEWKKANFGHQLEYEDMKLVLGNMLELCPPNDGGEDVGCLFTELQMKASKSGQFSFELPKKPVELYLMMPSNGYGPYM